MTTNELNDYLNNDNQLTVEQVKRIIYELKEKRFIELLTNIKFDKQKIEWDAGQMKAFEITLDLLERIKE